MAEPWIDVERDAESRYRKIPERVAELAYYDEVLTRVPRTIDYPGAVSTGVTEFFNFDEVAEVEGIGRASFRPERGTPESLRTLAFRSQGVVPIIPLTDGINASDFLSHYQTCRYPLKDAEGNIYIFRVVETIAGHVPESLDEVRDRVIADLQLKEGYEAAKGRAESLRSCAHAMTLVEAYETDDELVTLKDTEYGFGSGYFDPPPFARAPESFSFGGPAAPNFRDPITDPGIGRLIGGGVGLVPNEIVESLFTLADAEQKTAVFELPNRATVMTVEWLETETADGDTFEEERERLVRQLSFARTREILRDWMDPEQIRARVGFEIATDE